MNYWSRIGGAVIIAYLVFTTIKGNLRPWLQVIGLKPDTTAPAGSASTAGGLPGLAPLPQLRGRS